MKKYLFTTAIIIGSLSQPLFASAAAEAPAAHPQAAIMQAIGQHRHTLAGVQAEMRRENVMGPEQLHQFNYAKSADAARVLWDDRAFLTLIARRNDKTKQWNKDETDALWQEILSYPGNN